jgi:hypothetical protein
MSWHKVRCWDCGTTYEATFCQWFYEHYGSLEYCPRCGNDYLLGFSGPSVSMSLPD